MALDCKNNLPYSVTSKPNDRKLKIVKTLINELSLKLVKHNGLNYNGL